ncbi:CAP domain-containing protein [Paucibacter sp. hw1]|uniref:CAP domain-containing protein n=1 Tax=Roseateles koreensis TaxID=2987526 RepID=A0ABT5KS24_9BURK|nr:CAP domain-containing protein [Roseateles koreensis]
MAGSSPAEQREPRVCDGAPDPVQVLRDLNALRSQARQCGDHPFSAAEPLRWDSRLQASAQAYADEMARNDFFSHVDGEGRGLRYRVLRQGYSFRRVGENLAAGPQRLDEVITGWIDSAGHCENIMEPQFVDAGLACVNGPGRYARYWVLHLGRVLRE